MNKMRSTDNYAIEVTVAGGKRMECFTADRAKQLCEQAIRFVAADKVMISRSDCETTIESYYDIAHMTPGEWDELFDKTSIN